MILNGRLVNEIVSNRVKLFACDHRTGWHEIADDEPGIDFPVRGISEVISHPSQEIRPFFRRQMGWRRNGVALGTHNSCQGLTISERGGGWGRRRVFPAA